MNDATQEAEIFSAASEPARDDQGRFAAPGPEREPRSQDVPQTEDGPSMPNLGQLPDQGSAQGGDAGQPQAQRDPREAGMMRDLQDERRRRQEFERQLAERDRQMAEANGHLQAMRAMWGQMQGQGRQPPAPVEPQKVPEYWENPEAFTAHQAQQVFERQIAPYREHLERSGQQQQAVIQGLQRQVAVSQYGAEEQREAEEAFNTAAARNAVDPHEWRRIQSAPNPYAAAVEWHRAQRTLQTVGPDPQAWFQTETDRRLREDAAYRERVFAQLQGQAQAAGAQAPAAGQRAPVFAGLPSLNAAPGTSGQQSAPMSEADIFNAAPQRVGQRR